MTAPAQIHVRINDVVRALDAGVLIAGLVEELVGDLAARGVAVARNGEVLPRAEWTATALRDGDVVEIVRPVQGG